MKRGFLLVLSLFFLGTARAESRAIAIIVNSESNIESLSLEQVKGIFLGELQFVGGNRLRPIDQEKDEDIRQLFLREVLNMSKSEYTRNWMHLIFQGGIEAPILREDGEAVIRTVRGSKGGIGYVWADEASEAKGIKTVLFIHRPS